MSIYEVCWGDETCSPRDWHKQTINAKTLPILVKHIQKQLSNGYVLLRLDEVKE